MSVGAPAVVILRDPSDAVAGTGPVAWACGELRDAIQQAGLTAELAEQPSAPGGRIIAIASTGSASAQSIAASVDIALPTEPESLAIVPGQLDGRDVVLAAGADVRGLVYATLELADRVRNAADPLAALDVTSPTVERPANPIRGIN